MNFIDSPLVHIGYGKTGTTSLQEHFFPKIEGKYHGKTDKNYPQWLINLCYLDDFAFESQLESLSLDIRKEMDPNQLNIISAEAFTNLDFLKRNVDRLNRIFISPYILICLRDPLNWLISNYKYNVVYECEWRSLDELVDWGINRTPYSLEKRPPFYAPSLFYNEVVAYLSTIIGPDHLFVYRYEDWCVDNSVLVNLLRPLISFGDSDCGFVPRTLSLSNVDHESINRIRAENFVKKYPSLKCSLAGSEYFQRFCSAGFDQFCRGFFRDKVSRFYEI